MKILKRLLSDSFRWSIFGITKMGITLHWRRFRYRSLMRCKARNALYVPGVQLVHDSTYALSSVWQRHSRGAPAPRWCVPPEASCTSPSANPKTRQGYHFRWGSIPFTNAPQQATQPGSGDVEDIETERTHQGSVSESSPEQSYDLERDFKEHENAENCDFSRVYALTVNGILCRTFHRY